MTRRISPRTYPELQDWDRLHLWLAASHRGDGSECHRLLTTVPMVQGRAPCPGFVQLIEAVGALQDVYDDALRYWLGWLDGFEALGRVLAHPFSKFMASQGPDDHSEPLAWRLVRISTERVAQEVAALRRGLDRACGELGLDPQEVLVSASPLVRTRGMEVPVSPRQPSQESVQAWREDLLAAWHGVLEDRGGSGRDEDG